MWLLCFLIVLCGKKMSCRKMDRVAKDEIVIADNRVISVYRRSNFKFGRN